MDLSSDKLKELLVEPGHISEEDFKSALENSKNDKISLSAVLQDRGLISNENLGWIVGEHLGYKFVDLEKSNISEEVINIIPQIVARNQQVVAFDREEGILKVAMAEPNDFQMREWLEKKTGEDIDVYYSTPEKVRAALKYYKQDVESSFENIIEEQVERAKEKGAKHKDYPIIKIVDTLIEYAYNNRASDIHIEPHEEDTQVRYRVDGILHNVVNFPSEIHEQVITRIKVMARLRTDKHSTAQDGSFKHKVKGEKVDLRVSIVPVTGGEKAVMRLLADVARRFDLEDIGLYKDDLKKVKNQIKRPYGMILATGPTGSGKTTTLYSMLKKLNVPKVNISTIEDPVEYDIEAVNQIQVNRAAGLDFVSGLRSVVRQDPDIIMVGEVRDKETADIAVNSAMTGHLVLSTLHANTAASAFPRLFELEVEPFLTASSVNMVISQRLVREICTNCRKSKKIEKKELTEKGVPEKFIEDLMGKKKSVRVYEGGGCKECMGDGYSGRVAIFEILVVDEEIKKMIASEASTNEIRDKAVENGMVLMHEDGIRKVKRGVTTVEEVIRVTSE